MMKLVQGTASHRVVVWTLRTLTVVVMSLTVIAVYTIARVGGCSLHELHH